MQWRRDKTNCNNWNNWRIQFAILKIEWPKLHNHNNWDIKSAVKPKFFFFIFLFSLIYLKWQNINYYYNKGVFIILTIFPPPTHHFLPTDGGKKNSEFNKIIFIFPHLSCQRYEKKIILFLHFSPRSLPFQTKWRDFQHRLSCTVFFLNSFLQWKNCKIQRENILLDVETIHYLNSRATFAQLETNVGFITEKPKKNNENIFSRF